MKEFFCIVRPILLLLPLIPVIIVPCVCSMVYDPVICGSVAMVTYHVKHVPVAMVTLPRNSLCFILRAIGDEALFLIL